MGFVAEEEGCYVQGSEVQGSKFEVPKFNVQGSRFYVLNLCRW